VAATKPVVATAGTSGKKNPRGKRGARIASDMRAANAVGMAATATKRAAPTCTTENPRARARLAVRLAVDVVVHIALLGVERLVKEIEV
jgi:hypothetical protein